MLIASTRRWVRGYPKRIKVTREKSPAKEDLREVSIRDQLTSAILPSTIIEIKLSVIDLFFPSEVTIGRSKFWTWFEFAYLRNTIFRGGLFPPI